MVSKSKLSTILATENGRIHSGHHDSPLVQFGRREFLEIIYAEKPRIIYHKDSMHFFFLVGLKVCTTECQDRDFKSNHVVLPWIDEAVR